MQLLIKIKNLIPAALGIAQVILPIIKEALVGATRVCEIIFFWTKFDEKVIAKLNQGYNFVNNGVEKLKRFLLGMGWTL